MVEGLRSLLPAAGGAAAANGGGASASASASAMDEDSEPCKLRHVADDIEHFQSEVKDRARLARSASSNAYESDDEDDYPGGGGQRVQCAQQ